MRDFILVVTAFIVAATGASAVTWPVHSWLSLEKWIEFDKFAKWFTILAVAIATVGILRARKHLHWPLVGFDAPEKPWPYLLGAGFIAGFIMLGTLGIALYLLDIRVPDTGSLTPENLLGFFLSVLPAALAVSLIEETYFRGVQIGTLVREQRVVSAAIFPAIFYMGVHFLNPDDSITVNIPNWFHGTVILFSAPAAICRETDCVGAGIALFLAGVLLALIRLHGGHLVTCIGIHAGWITGIKLTKELTDFNHNAGLAFLAGGHDRFIGILAAVWLALPCLWLVKRLVKNT